MTKKAIKVIKRDERARREQAEAKKIPGAKTTPEAARDMVATVTEWVNELQQRHRTDTARAIKNLFSEPAPQTGEA